MYFPKKRVIKLAPFNISFQHLYMLAISSNNAVLFIYVPCYGGTGTYYVVVTYAYPLQDGTSTTNPHMIANRYRSIVVYYITTIVPNIMEICIHHENLPRQQTFASECYLFKTNNLSITCACESTTKYQISLIANTNFASSSNYCFTFDMHVTPYFPNCS